MDKKVVKVILTDTHLNESNIELNISIWFEAIDVATEFKCDLAHLGDVFDNRKRSGQSLAVLFAFYTILNYAKKKGVKIQAIPGNHDKIDLESVNSYLDVFSTHPALCVFNEPHRLHDRYDIEYCFVPYFKEDGEYLKQLKKVAEPTKDKRKVLLTHVGISGVRNNDGSIVSNEVTERGLDVFDLAFVGHYHNRSSINNKIFYIGSAMPHNFKEDNEKGFTILYHDLSFDYYEADFPKYLTYEFNIADSKAYLDTLETVVKNEKDNIRTIVVGDLEDLAGFDSGDFKQAGVKVVLKSNESVAVVEKARQEQIVQYDNTNILDAFETYCRGVEISKKIKSKGQALLKKVI